MKSITKRGCDVTDVTYNNNYFEIRREGSGSYYKLTCKNVRKGKPEMTLQVDSDKLNGFKNMSIEKENRPTNTKIKITNHLPYGLEDFLNFCRDFVYFCDLWATDDLEEKDL